MIVRTWIPVTVLVCIAPGARAQLPVDRGAFVLRTRGDTLVIERFARIADTVTGSISSKGQPRLDYVAILGPAWSMRSLALSVFRSDAPDAAPQQRVNIIMRNDSAIIETNGSVQRMATTHAAVPILNNSFALAELFTRRARANGGTADVPVWAVSGGMSLVASVRSAAGDSMVVSIAGSNERVRVDATGRILGGTIPAQSLEIIRVPAEEAVGLRVGRPDYSAPADAPYTATEVTLQGPGNIVLGGTLTRPRTAARVPAVITITGSGQEDRDEYIPVAGGYRPFRQVADTLGRRGIAVLRLDDRMIGASGGALGTSADYADDIRAAVRYLRARPDIDPDRIALVGHSEGGLIAPMVAADDPRISGIVLMAGPARTGLDIIHYQQRNAIETDPATPMAQRDSAIRVAAHALDSLARSNAWLAFFLRYDPLPTARRVHAPVLVLQGSTDHQVSPDQAPMLADAFRSAGNRDVTMKVFPGLNHLFVPDTSGQPAGYATLQSSRVTAEVLGTLADWLVRVLRASP